MALKWATGGGGLLAEASADQDASNRSYYGDTKLHFLSAVKGVADCLVPLKEVRRNLAGESSPSKGGEHTG